MARAATASRKPFEIWTIVSIAIFALLAFFLVYPLWCLLKESVVLNGKFSLDAFQRFFSQPTYWGSIINSVKVGLCVMVLSIIIGVPFSYFYTFYTLKGRKFLFIICLLCTPGSCSWATRASSPTCCASWGCIASPSTGMAASCSWRR